MYGVLPIIGSDDVTRLSSLKLLQGKREIQGVASTEQGGFASADNPQGVESQCDKTRNDFAKTKRDGRRTWVCELVDGCLFFVEKVAGQTRVGDNDRTTEAKRTL